MEVLSDETEQRAAFRATLIAEVAGLRGLIKDCETEKEALHERVDRAEGQIIVLKASNEIMERWVTFFKERSSEHENCRFSVQEASLRATSRNPIDRFVRLWSLDIGGEILT